MRGLNYMPGTKAKASKKPVLETEVRTRIAVTLKKLAAIGSIQWELADDAHWLLTCGEGYTQARVKEIFIDEYEKILGVKRELMDKRQHQNFKNHCSKIYEAIGLASELQKRGSYDSIRKGGKPFYNVYLSIFNQKALKPKANIEKQSKAQFEKEANEGVVNAEEYASNTVEPVKHKSNNKKESASHSRVESFSLDRELKEQLRKLIRGEPIVFYRMIAGFAEVNLLAEEWKQLALEEMEKLV